MRFIEALYGKRLNPPPIWIMRQAGRYLPEYRAIRQTELNFISFCLNPEKACRVTIQPIERYQFDASIIFSDILLILWAMNRNVNFIEGIGPRLDVIHSLKDIEIFASKDLSNKYEAVGKAVKLARQALPTKTALIGFSGAPWTLMTYLFEGGSSRDFVNTKSFLWQKPNEAIEIIRILTEKVAEFLIVQANQGVNALMLFDSWANVIPASWRNEIIYKSHQSILEILRKNNIDLPFISFPKGIGEGLINYANEVETNCIAIDQHTDPLWANRALPSNIAIQGNLDPLCLVTGGQQMKDEISRIIDCFGDRPHIFNLGHGVVPQTPPEHIQDLVDFIRIKWGKQ
tara:strand:+ start:1563 stop:2594 length:1032 start_codon:yes stop_codon:yes gene_type:complete